MISLKIAYFNIYNKLFWLITLIINIFETSTTCFHGSKICLSILQMASCQQHLISSRLLFPMIFPYGVSFATRGAIASLNSFKNKLIINNIFQVYIKLKSKKNMYFKLIFWCQVSLAQSVEDGLHQGS